MSAPFARARRLALGATATALVLAAAALALPPSTTPEAGDDTQLAPLPVPEPDCKAHSDDAARTRRAHSAAAAAAAKIARYPYAPAEGLAALELLSEAARCQALSGATQPTAELQQRARTWRARLERDYHSRFARYRRARAAEHVAEALHELAYLTDLLASERGAFAQELRRQQLELEERHTKGNTP